MRIVIAAVVAAPLLFVPRTSAADPGDRAATDDCARARKAGKPCVLDVGVEDVAGDAPTAGDPGIRAITFDPHGSLIRMRREFLREIVKTADDL